MYCANASQLPNASGHAASGEAPRERLGPRAVQARIAPVDKRRVGRDRQQQRQHRPQPVAYEYGSICTSDPNVHVHREGVVAPRDVLEPLLDAPVVLGLDDVLLAVIGPRVGAGGAQRDVMLVGQRE